jgi:hypothetical protein
MNRKWFGFILLGALGLILVGCGSLIYKTGIDAVAAFAQVWGLETLVKIWTIEAIVTLWGIIGWLGIRWVQQRYPDQAAT